MFKKHCLIYTADEIRKELKEFYTSIVADSVEDIVSGKCKDMISPVIWEKGIDNLSDEELAIEARCWAEMALDMYCGENKNNPATAILMFCKHHDFIDNKTFILTDLYVSDFQKGNRRSRIGKMINVKKKN